MSRTAATLEKVLFQEKLTFGKINVLVGAVCALGGLFLALVKFHVIIPTVGHPSSKIEAISLNPAFLISYNVIISLGFWAVFATRHRAGYYRLRAYIYGMLLGGLAGELLHFFAAGVLHI